MSEATKICDLNHVPYYKVTHKGNKMMDDLIILVCNDCISRSPYASEKLVKETIHK